MTAFIARVVVYDPINGWDVERQALLSRDVELVVPKTEEQADAELVSADAVIVTGLRYLDGGRIARLERCVGILCRSVGMDNVDRDAASAAGIPVWNLPEWCTDEVSDHALTLLLAAERRLLPIASAVANGDWAMRDNSHVNSIHRLRGQTLGILGAGRIGRMVAAKARIFGFRTIAFDPGPATKSDDLELLPLDVVLERSDALVLCAALTPASRGLLGADALERVKPGVIVVNIARGGLIDETALAAALRDGRVSVAALDVRESEPPDPQRDPLLGIPNVFMTPHIASASLEAWDHLHVEAGERAISLLERGGRIRPAAQVS